MFNIGDVVIMKRSSDVKMTVGRVVGDLVHCVWFPVLDGYVYTTSRDSFHTSKLFLYSEYIREKKLESLINVVEK